MRLDNFMNNKFMKKQRRVLVPNKNTFQITLFCLTWRVKYQSEHYNTNDPILLGRHVKQL